MIVVLFYKKVIANCKNNSSFFFCRELPKLSAHEEEGVHQNPQYTGQHHFHPVPHDHDYCERVVINVSTRSNVRWFSTKKNIAEILRASWLMCASKNVLSLLLNYTDSFIFFLMGNFSGNVFLKLLI